MQIKERPIPNAIILELNGDLTYAHRDLFKASVEAVRQKGCRHLILNMAEVRFHKISNSTRVKSACSDPKAMCGKFLVWRIFRN
jgi:hypothetical protein